MNLELFSRYTGKVLEENNMATKFMPVFVYKNGDQDIYVCIDQEFSCIEEKHIAREIQTRCMANDFDSESSLSKWLEENGWEESVAYMYDEDENTLINDSLGFAVHSVKISY